VIAQADAELPLTVLLVALGGAVALVLFAVGELRGRRLIPRNPQPFLDADPGALFLIAIALFLLYQVGAVLLVSTTTPWAGILVGLAAGAAAFRLAVRPVLRPRGRAPRRIAYGLLVFWISLPLVYGLSVLLAHFGVQGEQEQVVWLQERRGGWAWLAIYAVVVAPVCEEVGFRGLLYPALRKLGGRRLALVATAVVFGLVHVEQPAAVPPLMVFGVFLAYLVEATGSILPCIVAHMAFNGLTVGQILLSAG
jgi:membrane protease YdiL (CAAX protease family)